jgi:hypothetical protein
MGRCADICHFGFMHDNIFIRQDIELVEEMFLANWKIANFALQIFRGSPVLEST